MGCHAAHFFWQTFTLQLFAKYPVSRDTYTHMTISTAVSYDAHAQQLVCCGDWRIDNLPALHAQFKKLPIPSSGTISVKGSDIVTMDTAGAWLLNDAVLKLHKNGVTTAFTGFSPAHSELVAIIEKRVAEEQPVPVPKKLGIYTAVGKYTLGALQEFNAYFSFIGKLTAEALRILPHPKHYRLGSVASVIFKNGFQALPIIALLSFMIGVVITYQLGLQLQTYGANVYIVDLLGLSILREFSPLLTAIMVAGRSGSAYTAQLGMMKINQEVDALDTLGVTPAELLILPRITGLFIALPLLTMWADIFGVFGGMIMANNMLSVSFYDFIHRFPQVIPLRALLIGLGKAPVFALIIASVGCFQGMQVKQNADSVGANTTRSVVLGIFFIIVADALFSIIFSKMKL